MQRLISLAFRNVDKVLHVVCAYGATVTAGIVLHSIGWALLAGLAVSVLKEAYDQWSYKGWSWGDLAADVIGIVMAFLILAIAL